MLKDILFEPKSVSHIISHMEPDGRLRVLCGRPLWKPSSGGIYPFEIHVERKMRTRSGNTLGSFPQLCSRCLNKLLPPLKGKVLVLFNGALLNSEVKELFKAWMGSS